MFQEKNGQFMTLLIRTEVLTESGFSLPLLTRNFTALLVLTSYRV